MSRGLTDKVVVLYLERGAYMATEKERKKALRWYHNNKEYMKAYRIRQKMKLIEYKGGKCQKCGYDKPIPRAYDFHHRDPATKEFQISGQRQIGWLRLKKEVDKCDLLCKNCHAEIHDDPKKREELLAAYNNRLLKIEKCNCCNKEFKPPRRTATRCEDCRGQRFSKCPPLLELKLFIDKIKIKKETWVSAGKQYKVSDNAVRKWARRHNLI